MLIGFGQDIHDIRDAERNLQEWQFRFTAAERDLCDSRGIYRAASYAKRFVAKEAMIKAMGVNDRSGGVEFRDIEIVSTKAGRPTLVLHGGALLQFKEITPPDMICHVHLSISDYFPIALAGVIIYATPRPSVQLLTGGLEAGAADPP